MKIRSLFLFLTLTFSLVSWAQGTKRILVLGDSLTEGYGVAREKAFPSLLEKKIQKEKKDWVVINAGVSGSTSASAVSRLKWQMKNPPQLLILALGANDGLRGLTTEAMQKNLSEAIELAQKNKVKVVLAGMQMPPNYNPKYTKDFREVFPRLAKKYEVTLIPFLLDSVAAQPQLNQADGIHPNEKGHEIIAETVYKSIRGLL